MENNESNFTVLKRYEDKAESSLYGNMMQVYQLCQNQVDKSYYFTYEVLDDEGSIIGGRLTYNFKKPNQALEDWDKYINGELENSDDFTITKQEFFQSRKPRF